MPRKKKWVLEVMLDVTNLPHIHRLMDEIRPYVAFEEHLVELLEWGLIFEDMGWSQDPVMTAQEGQVQLVLDVTLDISKRQDVKYSIEPHLKDGTLNGHLLKLLRNGYVPRHEFDLSAFVVEVTDPAQAATMEKDHEEWKRNLPRLKKEISRARKEKWRNAMEATD